MPHLLAAALLLAPFGALSPPADTVMFRGGPAHTGAYATRSLDGYGGILWRASLPGPVRSTAALSGDVVYVGSSGGRLHALDRSTGRELWSYEAGAAVNGSPAVADGVVYVTDLESTLHAVDARTGRELWRRETGPDRPFPWGHESGDIYPSSPTLARVGGRVLLFFGAGDGSVHAVEPASGEPVWRFRTDGRVRSTPAVAGGILVVGSADGHVYGLDAVTGEERWRHATRGASLASAEFGFDRRTIQSSPAIADGRVHIGARDGFLYTLDLATGERLWDADHEVSWVNSSPALANGRVFAGTSDGQFVQALDAATGEELWRREAEGIVWTSPIVLGDEVVFAEGAGRVRSLDAETGRTRWSTFLPSRLWSSPVVEDGVLFLGTHGGGMYALRSAEGRPLRRAVFWDSTLTAGRWYLDHERLARWLTRRGFERLDAAALEAWLDERVTDGHPSSVVFALDHLPARLLEEGEASPLRRYLEAGGTAVWPGFPPALWRRDPGTGEAGGLDAVDWEGPVRLLGVDHDAGNIDPTGAWPTGDGRRLGLPEGWRSQWSVAPAESLEALATDERGHLASWRRAYGGPPGTGFVRLWGDRREPRELAPFLVAADWRPVDPERDEIPRGVAIEHALDRFVREGMARLGVPGLSLVGVTADGTVVERGWGVRDVELGGPVDARTGFYIASSTKSFVGLLTALLDDRGWLDLDAPLTECLPDLDLEGTVDPSSITLRDLLRHTKGWENDLAVFRTAYTDFLAPDELRSQLALTTTVEDDGHFAYDNDGFVVADLCFRERLGVDWKELVETQVLVPAGMTRTTPFVSEAAATGNFALPHVWDGVRHRRIPTKIDDLMHAAGGLVTTAEDAGRWIRLHLGAGRLDGRRVFPPDPVREVLTRQVDGVRPFPGAFSREGYGLGWFDGSYRGYRVVSHFGGYPGAQAHISLMPERGVGVAAFVNGGGGNAYLLPHLAAGLFYDLMLEKPDATERARAALAEAERTGAERLEEQRRSFERRERLRTRTVPISEARRLVGVYRSPARGNLIVTRTLDGGLWVERGALEGRLAPADEDGFLALWETRRPTRLYFELPEEGPARSVSFGGFPMHRVDFGGGDER